MIQRYDYPFSSETTAQILEHAFSKGFIGYHRISEAPMVIDGKIAVSFVFEFEGMSGSDGTPVHLPGKLFVVAVPNGDAVLSFTCQAPLSHFDQMQATLKEIVSSYHYSPKP